jgi:hypothetical protein
MLGIFSAAWLHLSSPEKHSSNWRSNDRPPSRLNARRALHLSKTKKRTNSRQLAGRAQLPPSDFHTSPHSILPRSLTLDPIPRKLASQLPTIRRDNYAVLKDEEVLLANPQTRKVVAVIKDWSDAGLGG